MFEGLIHIAERVAVVIVAGAIQFFAVFGVFEEDPLAQTTLTPHTNSHTPSLPTSPERVRDAYENYERRESSSSSSSIEENNTTHAPATTTSSETDKEEDSVPDESVATSSPPALSLELNTRVRNSLVNILCTTQSGSGINASSGSGIIIDERGIVLTNAHVAQYFLFEEKSAHNRTQCLIRGGAPADDMYDAIPLFLSSSWIEENAETITQDHPRGTGEYDVALLLITESLTKDTLPNSFPFIPLTSINDHIDPGTDVLVAGYPAEFLGGNVITRDLWPVTALTDILNIYTFGERSVDIFSVAGNIAAQQGSSGGGIVDIEKESLSGLVVTSSYAEQTKERELNAITPRHINHTIFTDTDMALSTYLSGNLNERAELFMENVAPDLRDTLLEVIRD